MESSQQEFETVDAPDVQLRAPIGNNTDGVDVAWGNAFGGRYRIIGATECAISIPHGQMMAMRFSFASSSHKKMSFDQSISSWFMLVIGGCVQLIVVGADGSAPIKVLNGAWVKLTSGTIWKQISFMCPMRLRARQAPPIRDGKMLCFLASVYGTVGMSLVPKGESWGRIRADYFRMNRFGGDVITILQGAPGKPVAMRLSTHISSYVAGGGSTPDVVNHQYWNIGSHAGAHGDVPPAQRRASQVDQRRHFM